MKKIKSKQHFSLVYDDKGAAEVSEQIMNSYRSGIINKNAVHTKLNHIGKYK